MTCCWSGTYGRGAWTIEQASAVLDQPGVLTICGDEDFVNQDDVIRLVRNDANPLLLDVYLNSIVPVFSTVLAGLNQINVFGQGGNDELIVDSSFGLITVPDGIRYDGDGICFDLFDGGDPLFGVDRGFDTLTLTQDSDDEQDSDQLAVGQLPGSGISTIVGDERDAGGVLRGTGAGAGHRARGIVHRDQRARVGQPVGHEQPDQLRTRPDPRRDRRADHDRQLRADRVQQQDRTSCWMPARVAT